MTLCEVTFWPDDKKILIRPNTSIFDAARKAHVSIRSRCGGKAACLMCKVKIEQQEALQPMNTQERLKLGTLAQDGYRLSCQALVKANCAVTVPEDPLKAVIRAQLAKQQEEFDL
jgi:2Fe-2S ferredoxin